MSYYEVNYFKFVKYFLKKKEDIIGQMKDKSLLEKIVCYAGIILGFSFITFYCFLSFFMHFIFPVLFVFFFIYFGVRLL